MLGCTVREAMRRVDATEFALWCALDRIEPIDIGQRIDTLFAHLCATVSGSLGGSAKVSDHLVRWEEETPEERVARMVAAFRGAAAAANEKYSSTSPRGTEQEA